MLFSFYTILFFYSKSLVYFCGYIKKECTMTKILRILYSVVSAITTAYSIFEYKLIFSYILNNTVLKQFIMFITIPIFVVCVIFLLFGLNRLIFSKTLYIGGFSKLNKQKPVESPTAIITGTYALITLLIGICILNVYTFFILDSNNPAYILYCISSINTILLVVFGIYRIALEE